MNHSLHIIYQITLKTVTPFMNKAVLTVASYTRTVYYKYNRILVLYHLPFAFMETN